VIGVLTTKRSVIFSNHCWLTYQRRGTFSARETRLFFSLFFIDQAHQLERQTGFLSYHLLPPPRNISAISRLRSSTPLLCPTSRTKKVWIVCKFCPQLIWVTSLIQFDTSSIVVFIMHYCNLLYIVIARFLYCTFIMYSAIRLSSHKCAINSVSGQYFHCVTFSSNKLILLIIKLVLKYRT